VRASTRIDVRLPALCLAVAVTAFGQEREAATTIHEHRPRIVRSENVDVGDELLRLSTVVRQEAGRPIALEAENATALRFTKGRGEACRDGAASGGLCLAHVQHAEYRFDVVEPGRYTAWYRGWFPWGGNWNHTEQMDGGPRQTVVDSRGEVLNQWLWCKGPTYELGAGRRSWELTPCAWMGGARLDKLVLLKQGQPAPEGLGPAASPWITPVEAVVLMQPATGQPALRWEQFRIENLAAGVFRAAWSTDGGKTWRDIPADGSLANVPPRAVPRFSLKLGLDPAGRGPLLTQPRIRLQIPRQEGIMHVTTTDGVRVEQLENAGFRCRTPVYEACVDGQGNLTSLRAGDVEFLAAPAGFARAGKLLRLKSVRAEQPGMLVAEGEPKAAEGGPASPCPLTARVTYRFKPDRIEMLLEQSLDLYGGFAWAPSAEVTASRDALTDCPTAPQGPALYGLTDPRWTTRSGPVLRFDFGVWQRAFANANWGNLDVDGKRVRVMRNTVPAALPMTISVFPLAQPAARDALAFDISAESPDFLMPGGKPVRFDIRVTNAGPAPVEADVRFEVRDYLTEKSVGARTTRVSLAPGAELLLPTDVAIEKPGPYRAAIVIEEKGSETRSFWWVFTYDFDNYRPATTRPPDFKQFWAAALKESATTPLDVEMTAAPEKDTAAAEAFRISYATLGGRRIYGWYSRPKKLSGKCPAQIRFPSSGVYPLSGPEMARDKCTLWIGIHGFDVDLSNMPSGPDPGKSYWTAGIASPQTSMWRIIYTSLVRAVDFMLAQPQVDPDRIAVVGGSQGGGLSMVAAGLDPRVDFCRPGHSGLPRLDWTVKHAPGYWPFGMTAKPAGQSEEQFLKTLAYFDAANFTQDIRCPVVAEVGMMDTVTASGNQICALAHVPRGQLYLVCSPWAMHGAGSRPGHDAGACYARFLKGETAILTPTKP